MSQMRLNNTKNCHALSSCQIDDDEDLETFFSTMGLHCTQNSVALGVCREQLVLTVGDLRTIARQDDMLAKLFPQLGLLPRVKAPPASRRGFYPKKKPMPPLKRWYVGMWLLMQ